MWAFMVTHVHFHVHLKQSFKEVLYSKDIFQLPDAH